MRKILIEAGPRILRSAIPGIAAKSLIKKTQRKHGIDLQLLIYDRNYELAHSRI